MQTFVWTSIVWGSVRTHGKLVRRFTRRGAAAALLGSALVLGVACGGDATSPHAMADLETGFWDLTTNHDALLMAAVAPYDTIQLVATPRNAHGAPLPANGTDTVHTVFVLADPTDTNVTVSASGLVRARHPDATAIMVQTTVGGVVRTVIIPVNVTADVPALPARLASVQLTPDAPLPLNSDTLGWVRTLTPLVVDANGEPIPDVPFVYRSSDSLIVTIDPTTGMAMTAASARGALPVTLSAAATVYGTPLRGSAVLTVTPPLWNSIVVLFRTPKGSTTPVGYFAISVDTIKAGATVSWSNAGDPTDITFDRPDAARPPSGRWFYLNIYRQLCGDAWAADSGNIAALGHDPTVQADTPEDYCRRAAMRSFPAAGTYPYHSNRYGTSGTIVVVP